MYLEELADAVADAINAETVEWPLEFTAERVADTTRTREELQRLTVLVHPIDLTRERLDRDAVQSEKVISIGIRQQIPVTTNEIVDPLNKLTQDLASFFDRFYVEGGAGEELLVSVADTPVLGDPGLLHDNLYLGVVRLVFEELP